jgi:hypothetical protein
MSYECGALGESTKTWYGESVGHYEGDTLLITPSIERQDRHGSLGTPHSDQIHVVERYRLSDDKQTLEVLSGGRSEIFHHRVVGPS